MFEGEKTTYASEFQSTVLQSNMKFFNNEDIRAKYFAEHIHTDKHPAIPQDVYNQYICEQVTTLLRPTLIDGVKTVIYVGEGPNSGKSQLSIKRKLQYTTAFTKAVDAEKEWLLTNGGKKPLYRTSVGLPSCIAKDIMAAFLACNGTLRAKRHRN